MLRLKYPRVVKALQIIKLVYDILENDWIYWEPGALLKGELLRWEVTIECCHSCEGWGRTYRREQPVQRPWGRQEGTVFKERQKGQWAWSWVSKGPSVRNVVCVPGACPGASDSACLCCCALAASSGLHTLDFGRPRILIQVLPFDVFILIIILRTVIEAFSGSSWWLQDWAKLWIS